MKRGKILAFSFVFVFVFLLFLGGVDGHTIDSSSDEGNGFFEKIFEGITGNAAVQGNNNHPITGPSNSFSGHSGGTNHYHISNDYHINGNKLFKLNGTGYEPPNADVVWIDDSTVSSIDKGYYSVEGSHEGDDGIYWYEISIDKQEFNNNYDSNFDYYGGNTGAYLVPLKRTDVFNSNSHSYPTCPDSDGDGVPAPSPSGLIDDALCAPPSNKGFPTHQSIYQSDCDDSNEDAYPGAVEHCCVNQGTKNVYGCGLEGFKDLDCDGELSEGSNRDGDQWDTCPASNTLEGDGSMKDHCDKTSGVRTKKTWRKDSDGDGYYSNTKDKCESPGNNWYEDSNSQIKGGNDCNDNDGEINPETVWYKDSDGDGYYAKNKTQCNSPGSGWTRNTSGDIVAGGDCNDDNSDVNPNSSEVCGNQIDDDCDNETEQGAVLDSGIDEGCGFCEVSEDGGFNLGSQSGSDKCVNQGVAVKEYWCNVTTGNVKNSVENCQNKYDSESFCVDGACVFCMDSDSDESNPYMVKGSATASPPLNETEQDTCKTNTELEELSCSSGQIQRSTYDCSSEGDGFVCKDGRCVCEPDYVFSEGSCGPNDKGTYIDNSSCSDDTKQGHCDYDNLGVIGDGSGFDSVKINGSDFDDLKNYTNTGVKEVVIEKSSQEVVFDWDTSGDELNLYDIEIEVSAPSYDNGYIMVDGLDRDKRVTLDRSKETDKICVDDSHDANTTLNISSGSCNGPDEVYLECPGNNTGYECKITGSNDKYEVWPLEHSIAHELDEGNYSFEVNKKCESDDWDCSPSDWSSASCINGTKTRNCTKKSNVSCSQGYQPNESISCSENDSDNDDPNNTDSGSLPECVEGEHYECAGWSKCHKVGELKGTQTRSCQHLKDCKNYEGVKKERDCSTGEDQEKVEGESSVFDNGFPWTIALIAVGAIIIVLVVVLAIWKMNSSGSNAPPRGRPPVKKAPRNKDVRRKIPKKKVVKKRPMPRGASGPKKSARKSPGKGF